MDLGPILAVVGSLVAIWALLIAVLWFVRPRDVALRELVAIVPDVLGSSGT